MTYCALLALAVLRDDYTLLDRAALARMVGACQDEEGGCVLFFCPSSSFTFFYFLSTAPRVPIVDLTWCHARALDLRRFLGRAMLISA
jgi:hypothetical protein